MSSEGDQVETKPKSSGDNMGKLKRQDFECLHQSAQAELPSPSTSSTQGEERKTTREILQDLLDHLNSIDPEISDSESLKKSDVSTSMPEGLGGNGTHDGKGCERPSSQESSCAESIPVDQDYSADYADLEFSLLDPKLYRRPT